MTATMEAPARQTMPMEEVLRLVSGDHGGRIEDFPYGGARNWRGRDQWYWGDRDYKWVDEIAADMQVNGWDGPPICILEGVLRNGHHRTIAAYMAGLPEVPWTTNWSESEEF